MVSVFVGHDLFGFPYKNIIYTRHLGFGILQNVFLALQCFGACQIQQRIAVVKQRSRGNDFVGVAVHEETEIPVMPVGIENDGVKNDHVIQCLDIFLAQRCVECPDGFHPAAADNSSHRHEGNIFAGEQLTGGAQGLLPAGDGIVDGVDFQNFGNLGGVELGVRLEPGVGGALGTAFVEADDAALSAPAFWKHAARGKLRAGGQDGAGAAKAGKGNLPQHAAEPVVIEIEFLKAAGEIRFGHPVAIVQAQSFGDLQHIHWAIQTQSHGAEKIVHICPVARDGSVTNPGFQAGRTDFCQIQWEQLPAGFVYGQNLNIRLRTALGRKGNQRRIKMF